MTNRIFEELQKTWGTDSEMIDYCAKENVYIVVDNNVIKLGNRKPKINSEIWYDDKHSAPHLTKDLFFKENDAYSNNFINDIYLFKNTEGSDIYGWACPENDHIFNTHYGHLPGFRKATDEESRLIKKEYAVLKAHYLKRLESYWKRYQDKIRVRGYWADR